MAWGAYPFENKFGGMHLGLMEFNYYNIEYLYGKSNIGFKIGTDGLICFDFREPKTIEKRAYVYLSGQI